MSDESLPLVPRCPRCRFFPYVINEYWDGCGVEWSVDDRGVVVGAGNAFSGIPSHMEAVCNCGHHWRIRGHFQITQFHKEEPDADLIARPPEGGAR